MDDVTDSSVHLVWEAPPSDGGAEITKYIVEAKPADSEGDDDWVEVRYRYWDPLVGWTRPLELILFVTSSHFDERRRNYFKLNSQSEPNLSILSMKILKRSPSEKGKDLLSNSDSSINELKSQSSIIVKRWHLVMNRSKATMIYCESMKWKMARGPIWIGTAANKVPIFKNVHKDRAHSKPQNAVIFCPWKKSGFVAV